VYSSPRSRKNAARAGIGQDDVTEPYRVGLIGCGFFAQNQLAAWAAIPDVRLVAVCDLDAEKGRAAADRFGAVPYTSAEQMLAGETLDFVDIATTMPSHRPLVELVASRGLPLIVQKPLAPTWDDCRAIVAGCRDAGVPMMVHENTRFLAPIRAAQQVVRSGALGALTWGRIAFRTGHDIYAKQPYLAREPQFIILDLGVHMLDIARYLLGDAEWLYCQTNRVKPGISGEDMATVMLRHANGASSVVECSYASQLDPDPFPQVLLQLEGTLGSLALEPGYRMTVVSEGHRREHDVAPRVLPWATPPWHGVQESVLAIQRHWVDCLRQGATPETDGLDSLKTYGLVFAAYQSARTGRAMAPLQAAAEEQAGSSPQA
jgi:predicted dehydrogenase